METNRKRSKSFVQGDKFHTFTFDFDGNSENIPSPNFDLDINIPQIPELPDSSVDSSQIVKKKWSPVWSCIGICGLGILLMAYLEWSRESFDGIDCYGQFKLDSLSAFDKQVKNGLEKQVAFPMTALERAHIDYIEKLERQNKQFDQTKYKAINKATSDLINRAYWEYQHEFYTKMDIKRGAKRYNLVTDVYKPLLHYLWECLNWQVICQVITVNDFCNYQISQHQGRVETDIFGTCYMTVPADTDSKFHQDHINYVNHQTRLQTQFENQLNQMAYNSKYRNFTTLELLEGRQCIDLPYELEPDYLMENLAENFTLIPIDALQINGLGLGLGFGTRDSEPTVNGNIISGSRYKVCLY